MDILIVEDDAMHRAFLKAVVTNALPEGTCIREAEDGVSAVRQAEENESIDSVIMDLQMPQMNGVEAAKRLWRCRPDMKILFWSNYSEEAYVRGISRIVPDGAVYGYILKSAAEELLQIAMQGVFIGEQCVIDRTVQDLQKTAGNRSMTLTEAELEVLVDLFIGLTDKAIAHRRKISLRSVQARLQGLYGKLGLERHDIPTGPWGATFNPRSRAISVALSRGLVTLDLIAVEEERVARWLDETADGNGAQRD
ncbi:response regulator transcription factor [Hoeflea prorocentri]|uniref:Response regulator transcription factor n=1 Tax=Hoeflea prorocentri TaxID=1922333 RepID=A0A9X3ZJR0_9HYPH|nr:response regulator transcription factor [Hoeflea prorocentri]MCY6383714.1 response regulator transcription factor [Hoeflea prorocentri]MDA5401514.1 response regulator transcription factor [Hoeflea prorocentri]